MALMNLETYYSVPNIDESDNSVKIFVKEWHDIHIPTGSYEIKAIEAELKRQVKKLGGEPKDLTLEPNLSTLKCILTLKNKLKIDFDIAHSIKDVLGFEAKVFTAGTYSGTKIVSILNVNAILVHCDVIKGSRFNGNEEPIIFSFFPDVPPGYKLIARPSTLIYLPLTMNVISRMTVWLSDQANRLLDLREEELTISFHIRAC